MHPLNELEWLLEVSPESHPDGDGIASMERLVTTSIDHLDCVSGALVLRNGLNVRVRSRSAESLGGNLLSLQRLEAALIDGIGSCNATDLERHLPCAPLGMTCKVITVPVTGRSSEPLGAL